MNLVGNLKIKEKLIGNIHLLKKVHGYSAYDLAVKYGYKGTEEEWIQSLKGPKGDPGTLENHSGIDALNLRVENVATPEEDGDAVNKAYIDDKCNGFVSSEIVDISDDFISVEGDNCAIHFANVYKQGNVISGTVLIGSTCLENERLFTIAEKYRPKANTFTPCVTAQGYMGSEEVIDIPVCDLVIRYIGGSFKVLFRNMEEAIAGAFLSFTYICN